MLSLEPIAISSPYLAEPTELGIREWAKDLEAGHMLQFRVDDQELAWTDARPYDLPIRRLTHRLEQEIYRHGHPLTFRVACVEYREDSRLATTYRLFTILGRIGHSGPAGI